MIDLDEKSLDIVRHILHQQAPNIEVLAFGSRVKGRAAKYSDLDLALKGNKPINWQQLEKLRDAFAESDLPISVDILDWHSASAEFKAIIEKNHVVLNPESTFNPGC